MTGHLGGKMGSCGGSLLRAATTTPLIKNELSFRMKRSRMRNLPSNGKNEKNERENINNFMCMIPDTHIILKALKVKQLTASNVRLLLTGVFKYPA